jgi:hypothetical protein
MDCKCMDYTEYLQDGQRALYLNAKDGTMRFDDPGRDDMGDEWKEMPQEEAHSILHDKTLAAEKQETARIEQILSSLKTTEEKSNGKV